MTCRVNTEVVDVFLRMIQTYSPTYVVTPYVASVSVIEHNASSPFVLPVVPDGNPGIMISISRQAVMLNQNKALSSLLVYGQSSKPMELSLPAGSTAIIYHLHPHVLRLFADLEVTQLLDDCQSLGSATRWNQLLSEVQDAPTLQQRMACIDRCIVDVATRRPDVNSAVAFATQRIRERHGCIALPALRDGMGLSERAFQRLFEDYVGVPPKLFSRICQFQYAFRCLENGTFTKLSDVAYASGYADQSHFIRAFRQFTDLSPRSFLKRSA